jgi:dihydroxyacid dehydratase/phosphogluconate dehydratase
VQTIADRIDDPALGIDESSVLVLRDAGPIGAAMPEWGMLPLPRHLLENIRRHQQGERLLDVIDPSRGY